MNSSSTDPADDLRRQVARDWLNRYPGVLAMADEQAADAQARGDTEAMNHWLDWRADAEHLADLSRDVLEGFR